MSQITTKTNDMITITRGSETLRVEDNKSNLYESCGWTVVDKLLTFKNKEDEDQSWMQRFGN